MTVHLNPHNFKVGDKVTWVHTYQHGIRLKDVKIVKINYKNCIVEGNLCRRGVKEYSVPIKKLSNSPWLKEYSSRG